jgi:GGDEF domain-containing protein
VHQWLPLRFNVTLETTEEATFTHQNTFMHNSMLLGLLLFIALFALVLGVAYKSKAYAWYGIYVGFIFLAIASYLGVGFYAFWPSAPAWAETSHSVCLMAAITAQLLFCRAMFLDGDTSSWLSRVTLWGAVLSALATVVHFATPQVHMDFRISTVLLTCAFAVLMMLFVVVRAAWQRSVTAWVWLAAFAPVIGVLGLTLAEQFGLLALPWLPYSAIGLAVGIEVLILLLALHLHAKSTLAREVRRATLAQLDSLTGFVSALYYPDTLAQLWSQARHLQQDMALAYVRAEVDEKAYAAALQLGSDAMVLRCVRMLRMVTRSDDTVARLGGNMFAILMPGVSPGPNFSGKLSRLVKLGVISDADDTNALPIQFRIVASSFSSFSGTSAQVDTALKEKLLEIDRATPNSIAFVKNR